MVGRTRYAIPSVNTLHRHYNVELLTKKKMLREELAEQKQDLEGRMTVKDLKVRQTYKEVNNPDPLHSYISNFKDCAKIFTQQSPKPLDKYANVDSADTTPFMFG